MLMAGLAQRHRDRRNTAAMWSNLGESARFRGDFQRAEQLYQKALDAVREIGHRDSEAIYLTNLSGAQLGLRKFVQAEAELREAIELTRGNSFCALSETYSNLSQACIGQNKLEDALVAAQRALVLAQESENDLDLGTSLRALGHALSLARSNGHSATPGSADAAQPKIPEQCFADSLSVFQKIKAEVEQARTLRAWAQHDLRHARTDQSKTRLREAGEIFKRVGARTEAEETEHLRQEPPA